MVITLATSGLASADRKNKSCVALMGALRAQPALCYADVLVEWVESRNTRPLRQIRVICSTLLQAGESKLSQQQHAHWLGSPPRSTNIGDPIILGPNRTVRLDASTFCCQGRPSSTPVTAPLLLHLAHCLYSHLWVLASSNSICP